MESIERIEKSPLKNKRFRVFLSNKSHYDFGLLTGSTYIDHHEKAKRDAYRKRHLANGKEKQLIESYTPSPSLFAFYLLWGETTSIEKNIKLLNKHLS